MWYWNNDNSLYEELIIKEKPELSNNTFPNHPHDSFETIIHILPAVPLYYIYLTSFIHRMLQRIIIIDRSPLLARASHDRSTHIPCDFRRAAISSTGIQCLLITGPRYKSRCRARTSNGFERDKQDATTTLPVPSFDPTFYAFRRAITHQTFDSQIILTDWKIRWLLRNKLLE